MLSEVIVHGPCEGNSRRVRAWLPPAFGSAAAAMRGRVPVLLLLDGQNVFYDEESYSGSSWRAAEAASALIAAGAAPPFAVAAIDNAGARRPYEYLPYRPGMGPGDMRPEAADWPGGGISEHLGFVLDHVAPALAEAFPGLGANEPALRAFGGSSFGGVAALHMAMERPDDVAACIFESPSFWVEEGRLLERVKTRLSSVDARWPARMYIAMGTKEYSTREGSEDRHDLDDMLSRMYGECVAWMGGAGLSARVRSNLVKGATHSEEAWAKRLPEAALWVAQPWWGVEGAMRAAELAAAAADTFCVDIGRAANDYLEARDEALQAAEARALDDVRAAVLPPQPLPGKVVRLLAWADGPLAGAEEMHAQVGFDGWSAAISRLPMEKQGGGYWAVTLRAPEGARELNVAFTDGEGERWDNAEGKDYNFALAALPAPPVDDVGPP
eukprot:PRCOL_00006966-RA